MKPTQFQRLHLMKIYTDDKKNTDNPQLLLRDDGKILPLSHQKPSWRLGHLFENDDEITEAWGYKRDKSNRDHLHLILDFTSPLMSLDLFSKKL